MIYSHGQLPGLFKTVDASWFGSYLASMGIAKPSAWIHHTHMVVTGFCSATETEAEMIATEFSFWDSESLCYSLDSLQAVNLWT